ncbi:chaperone modulator CbpM [Litoreibacter arenae]|uniref:Transcriptional regulator, MerR family n=1 Tax=Litoreibacter arenae DSM 19593 TaxID=1123360 RepID=S9QKN2_9RHOB|nr:chaperone modulator CbpM [Litoreibacter arenae]EPX80123.1 transcriptional regulator, MerR family [Litoreibacter arenae DSM 19593]
MKKAKMHKDEAETLDELTLHELCRFCDADEAWVVQLIQHGVVEPRQASGSEYSFSHISVLRAKKARRLERDLGVNMPGIALALDLLEERDHLRRMLGRFGLAS